VRIELTPGRRHQVTVQWDGGLEIVARLPRLSPGQRSTGVRILDFSARDGGFDVLLEGERGRTYDLQLHGTRPLRTSSPGAEVLPTATFYEVLRVAFPGGAGRATAQVRLTR
jgi:hypothetical protein